MRESQGAAAATAASLEAATTSKQAVESKECKVNVLWFHPELNPETKTVYVSVQAEDFAEPLEDLEPKVVSMLAKEFRFRADETTVRFYSVRGIVCRLSHRKPAYVCTDTVAQKFDRSG